MALILHQDYNSWLLAVNRSQGTQNVLDTHHSKTVVTVYSNILTKNEVLFITLYTRFSHVPYNLYLPFRLKMKAYECTSEGQI